MASLDEAVLQARALVLHDLTATRFADAAVVSSLEDAVSTRRWWASQWQEGIAYVAGLVAQDIQDSLMDQGRRWPECPRCTGAVHTLTIEPELGGPDPVWVCEHAGAVIAPLGEL
jgi:hypothetical protein